MLSSTRLHQLIDEGVIDALHENVNAASIDVRLSPKILLEGIPDGPVDIANKQSPKFYPMDIPEEGFIIHPDEIFLGSTIETFNLPDTISAKFYLRSSVGRCFLEHMQAGFIDAGFNNAQLTLELKNMTQYHKLRIRAGMRIGQIVFFEHENTGSDSYRIKGTYNGQQGPTKAYRNQ